MKTLFNKNDKVQVIDRGEYYGLEGEVKEVLITEGNDVFYTLCLYQPIKRGRGKKTEIQTVRVHGFTSKSLVMVKKFEG